MTTVWKPTENAWWIWLIPIVVFTLVGGAIIVAALHMPSTFRSEFLGLSRRTELIILGVFFIAAPILFSASLFLFLRGREKDADRIESEGIPATAEILSFEHTGTTVNNLPQYRFRLMVRTEDGTSMEVGMKSCIGLLQLQNIREGNVFRAKIDPVTHDSMVVDFGKIISEG